MSEPHRPDRPHADLSHPEAHRPAQRGWVTWALAGLVVVLLAVTFAIARTHSPDAQFGGADSNAVAALEEQGVTPWFHPVLVLNSPELESGLFAAQAALGGAVLGWAVGRLQSRREIRRLRESRRADVDDAADDTVHRDGPGDGV